MPTCFAVDEVEDGVLSSEDESLLALPESREPLSSCEFDDESESELLEGAPLDVASEVVLDVPDSSGIVGSINSTSCCAVGSCWL